jgi:hypothetical protein
MIRPAAASHRVWRNRNLTRSVPTAPRLMSTDTSDASQHTTTRPENHWLVSKYFIKVKEPCGRSRSPNPVWCRFSVMLRSGKICFILKQQKRLCCKLWHRQTFWIHTGEMSLSGWCRNMKAGFMKAYRHKPFQHSKMSTLKTDGISAYLQTYQATSDDYRRNDCFKRTIGPA